MHFQPCFSKADQKHQKVSADTDVPFSCCRLTSGISCASRDRHRRRHMALDVLPLAVSVHGGAYRVSYLPAEPPTWQRAGTSLLPCAEDISPHRRRHFTAALEARQLRSREPSPGQTLSVAVAEGLVAAPCGGRNRLMPRSTSRRPGSADTTMHRVAKPEGHIKSDPSPVLLSVRSIRGSRRGSRNQDLRILHRARPSGRAPTHRRSHHRHHRGPKRIPRVHQLPDQELPVRGF
ncbi:uncharacterized protein [Dermacentor albipictus]|uniref:uncharacterized protein isoform X1 n=1 Tax=Dermacentor albipictus TaxID=60249 RepID=UPI0038FC5361